MHYVSSAASCPRSEGSDFLRALGKRGCCVWRIWRGAIACVLLSSDSPVLRCWAACSRPAVAAASASAAARGPIPSCSTFRSPMSSGRCRVDDQGQLVTSDARQPAHLQHRRRSVRARPGIAQHRGAQRHRRHDPGPVRHPRPRAVLRRHPGDLRHARALHRGRRRGGSAHLEHLGIRPRRTTCCAA